MPIVRKSGRIIRKPYRHHMNISRKKPRKGWFGEPRRHALARKGVKTRRPRIRRKSERDLYEIAIAEARERLMNAGKVVTKHAVMSIAIPMLIAHGVPGPIARVTLEGFLD